MKPKGPSSFEEATGEYRAWLASKITITEEEWDRRRERLSDCTLFEFFRATYYRWAQWWPAVCGDLDDATQVLGIGDLHAENFGTWRDAEDRLVWGVNDLDEASCLPYTADLVRLATSVRLAIDEHHAREAKAASPAEPPASPPIWSPALDREFKAACEALLAGYREALGTGSGMAGRRPIVLAEDETTAWLRDIVIGRLQGKAGRSQYAEFLDELRNLDGIKGGVPVAAWDALRHRLPEGVGTFRIGRRTAGLGSLGRQRVTAVVDDWRGSIIAREAKALAPSAWRWWTVDGRRATTSLSETLLGLAIRSPDPSVSVVTGERTWVVRRLAPDSGRIKLKDLPKDGRLEDELLRAMGHETANVQVPLGDVRKDVEALTTDHPEWLYRAATAMAERVAEDFAASR